MTFIARLALVLALSGAVTLAGCSDGRGSLAPVLGPTAVPPATSLVRPADSHEPAAPLTVAIVGTSGSGAFAPNPLQAAAGAMVVWKNDDATTHFILLADGTPVGTIAPGESSAPVPMNGATVSYYCTIHPSMVGTIQDPSAPPMPAPPADDYYPPPRDPYDDGGYY